MPKITTPDGLDAFDEINRLYGQVYSLIVALANNDAFETLALNDAGNLLWMAQDKLKELDRIFNYTWSQVLTRSDRALLSQCPHGLCPTDTSNQKELSV